MKAFLFILLTVVVIALLPAAQAAEHAFSKEIDAFEASDKTNPPPQNAILFVGSSSLRKWNTLAKDFPDHHVINRGFGGSQASDSLFYFDRLVPLYKPKAIVYYEGSNDLNAHKGTNAVIHDIEEFISKAEAAVPGVKILFISINASPSRWKDVEKVRAVNAAIEQFMKQAPNRYYIDVLSALLDADGEPQPSLYQKDQLHPNAKGYAIWQQVIAPYLAKVDPPAPAAP